MSYKEDENFIKYEDLYWEKKAKKADKEGFLSKEESKKFLDKIIEVKISDN